MGVRKKGEGRGMIVFNGETREYVVEHVLREAHKICIAMSVTLGIAAVQKSAEDTLIGAELVQKML